MNNKKRNERFVLCYFYNKSNLSFWDYLANQKENYQEIIVINLSSESIEIEDQDIKIFNFDKANYLSEFSDLIYSKRFQADYMLLLENDEKTIIGDNFNNLNCDYYNVHILPGKPEILEYDIEPFTTLETRLISFKAKDLKEFLHKGDFFYNEQYTTLSSDIFHITKNEINPSLEIIKASIFDKESVSNREKFYFATSFFYKNSILSEKIYIEILDSEESEYKPESIMMLFKLLARKQEFERIIFLSEKYIDLSHLSAIKAYVGFAKFETWNFGEAIKYFHQSIKTKNELYIYNNSDLSWKVFKTIGDIFYRLQRFKNSEKYLKIASKKLGDFKSPEISLLRGKIKFQEKEYDESFKIFSEMLKMEHLPERIIKDAKYAVLNLLLFIDFKEEFLEILSLEYFNKPDDILRIADTFYMNEGFIEALQLYLLAVNKFGADEKLLFKLGYISSKLKSLQQACYYFEKYLEKVPDDLNALNNLAFVYLTLEKLELAEKTYHKILEINSYSFEANLHLAIIYMSQSNKAKAIDRLEKAKTLNPASSEIIKLYQIFKTEFK